MINKTTYICFGLAPSLRSGQYILFYRLSRLVLYGVEIKRGWKSNKFHHIRHGKSVYFSVKVPILKIWSMSCFHIPARGRSWSSASRRRCGRCAGGQVSSVKLGLPCALSCCHVPPSCALCCRLCALLSLPWLFPRCRSLCVLWGCIVRLPLCIRPCLSCQGAMLPGPR